MEKLKRIQQELKANKDQTNSYGGFNYRSAEGIYEAVKPLLERENCTLTFAEEVRNIGAYNYVYSSAFLKDLDTNDIEAATTVAREAASKKGMDDAQVTGACISYARKYAMCGLFLIDDAKNDPDSDYQTKRRMDAEAKEKAKEQEKADKELAKKRVSLREARNVAAIIEETGADMTAFLDYFHIDAIDQLTVGEYEKAVKMLEQKKEEK